MAPSLTMEPRKVRSLTAGYARFCDLLILVEEYLAAGNLSPTVRLAQIAARYAYPGNVGLFGSPRLERLLLELGKQIPSASGCGVWHREEHSRNVLHVLSYGRPVGGDSRFVWRWMQEDRNSRHSVAITTQADIKDTFDVPELLRQSAESSGGFLRTLSAPTSNPLEQARELRALCQQMDIVALHLFPYDVVPLLALAAGCDSIKTLFVNHSDHTFWIGASVAHSVVHLRRQSPHFLRKRRGLYPDKSSILPIPLKYSPPSSVDLPEIVELGDRLLREMGYWGVAEVEFMRDEKAHVYNFIEVNGRFWGWHTLARAAGINFPKLVYDFMHGVQSSVPSPVIGVKWIRAITDLPTVAREMICGRLSLKDYIGTIRGKKEFAVFSIKDPLPSFVEIVIWPYLWVKRAF
jgi:hypothetical protein